MQTVLVLHAQLQQLTNSLHVGKCIVEREAGHEVEMDVLYVGQARAFAVTPNRLQAAVGTPTRNGWQWAWQPGTELATAVSQALAIYNKEQPAAFVPLPFSVGRVEQ